MRYFSAVGLSVLTYYMFMASLLYPSCLQAEAEGEKWKDIKVSIEVYQEDIKDTLRTLARENGSAIVFGEGVEGEVTLKYVSTPIKEAFESIVEGQKLGYYWTDNTVHVFKKEEKIQREIISLVYLEMDKVKETLKRLKLIKKESPPIFDEESKTILITGTKDHIELVKTLITKLEKDTIRELQKKGLLPVPPEDRKPPEIRIFRLNYAKVGDYTISYRGEDITVEGIEKTLKDLLGLKEAKEIEKKSILAKGGAVFPVVELKTPGEEQKPALKAEEIDVGSVAIDRRTNSLIVMDYPDRLDIYEEAIKQLDQPVSLIELSVYVVTAQIGTIKDLGIHWGGGVYGRLGEYDAGFGGDFGERPPGAPSESDITGTGENTPDTTEKDKSGDYFGLIDRPAADNLSRMMYDGSTTSILFSILGEHANITARLKAAEDEGKLRILSNPRVVTLDNRGCYIESASEVNVEIEGGVYAGSTIETVDAGIIMNITPHIIVEGEKRSVLMDIHSEDSSFEEASGGRDLIPNTTRNIIRTELMVLDSSTVVLGGIYRTRTSNVENGVPFLKNIPLFGNLFKDKSKRTTTNELLVFITPRIIDSLDDRIYSPQASSLMKKKPGELEDNMKLLEEITKNKEEKSK